jgi:hypothetical protein
MLASVGTAERIGNILAKQSTSFTEPVGIPGLKAPADINVLDQGVLPFDSGMGNVNEVQKVGGHRRRRIDPLSPKTPGDGVLSTIQNLRNKFREIQHSVENLVKSKQDFTTADLMKMQYDVMQLAYLNELSSKTADKTSQGAQTLFRNQG